MDSVGERLSRARRGGSWSRAARAGEDASLRAPAARGRRPGAQRAALEVVEKVLTAPNSRTARWCHRELVTVEHRGLEDPGWRVVASLPARGRAISDGTASPPGRGRRCARAPTVRVGSALLPLSRLRSSGPAGAGRVHSWHCDHAGSAGRVSARRRLRSPRDPRRGDRVRHGAIVPAARLAPPPGRKRSRWDSEADRSLSVSDWVLCRHSAVLAGPLQISSNAVISSEARRFSIRSASARCVAPVIPPHPCRSSRKRDHAELLWRQAVMRTCCSSRGAASHFSPSRARSR